MIRNFALAAGIVFLAVGILGFVPGLVQPMQTEYDMVVDANHGMLFGLFPVNLLHNLVHIAIGIWGIAAYRSLTNSRWFAQGLAVFYAVLAILGLIPATQTLFGLVPLHGHDVWLHALTAVVAAYFGWVAQPETGAPTGLPGQPVSQA